MSQATDPPKAILELIAASVAVLLFLGAFMFSSSGGPNRQSSQKGTVQHQIGDRHERD